MAPSPPLRSFVPLAIGLSIGAAGAVLFLQSLPGTAGSAEARARELEAELRRAQNRLAAREARPATDRPAAPRHRDELTRNARRLAEDIRAGRPVSPDDIFRATQPLLLDLAPLFDRLRVKEQQRSIETLTGELARKYQLPPPAQEALKNWFRQQAEENAGEWNDLIAAKSTRLEDLARASRDLRLDADLDRFLPGLLSPGQRTAFLADRRAQRDARVQAAADRKVEQLDAIAALDEAQRDQIFALAVRSSKDYDPSMVLQGSQGPITPAGPVADRETAFLAVLRPEQRAAYTAEQSRRRDEAAKEMEAIGLTLPADWRMFDENDF